MSVEIIVCVKQIPTVRTLSIDPRAGALKRESVPGVINQEDLCALEEALLLKEKHGGKVTALSMGPPQAEIMLREALAMGVNRAILLCDRAFAGSDTLATSHVLAQAIRKLGNYDLILCGKQTADGSTGQVGPELAELLDLPQVTSTQRLEVSLQRVVAERTLDSSLQLVETRLPALITVTRSINKPRPVSVDAIIIACREMEVTVWKADDLGIEKSSVGLLGSATRMASACPSPPKKRAGEMLEGTTGEVVKMLLERLRKQGVI